MSRILPLMLLSALPLVACGGEEDGAPKAEGPHYTYVVSQASVPTSNPQATEFGLDLNGDKIVDNQLGAVLAALSNQGFDLQGAITKAIAEGDIILLADIQTPSFSSSSGTGFQVKIGDKATAMPAPCTGANDTTCGHHLDGTGSFTVSADSPTDIGVTGKIVGGTFTGGPGNISIKIALGGPQGIQLDLIGARAKASGISETGVENIVVGGALSIEDLNTQVIPAIQGQLQGILAVQCPGTTGDCGCPTGTGHTILTLFDTNPKDCKVQVDEIQNSPLIKSLLAPDVTIDGQMALSIGIKVKAVKGTIR